MGYQYYSYLISIRIQSNKGSMIAEKPSLSGQEAQLSSRVTLQFTEQIYAITMYQNHFICSAPSKIIVYNNLTKEQQNIKVCTADFKIVEFPPYIFACFITQFIYMYTEDALKDVTKIIKIKISKLNVKAICGFNKGYFMAGANRSPFPGGNISDKRSIYFMENLTDQKKNKPLWEISLPKSRTPVTILEVQNPYLMCYCEPSIYIINPFQKQILVSFQKEFESLSLLEGRFALNCVNMIGISMRDKAIISVDVEKYPIFGVQLNEYKEKANSVCQSRQGNIYACYENTIFMYNLFKKQKKVVKQYQKSKQVLQLLCSPKNVLLALIKSTEQIQIQNDQLNEDRSQQQKSKPLQTSKSLDVDFKEEEQKNQKFSYDINQLKSNSYDANFKVEDRRYVEVFIL